MIDIDVEMLARLQAARQRDVTLAEELEDNAEVVDEYRKRRDLEREHSNERRHEKWEDAYERRSAELDHAKNVRQIECESASRVLEADIKRWKEEEEAMKAAAAVFEEAADKSEN